MSILIEKGTKMITKFAIKVHEVITDTKTGHSNEYQPTYFSKVVNTISERISTTQRPEVLFATRKEAWEVISGLPATGTLGQFSYKYTYSIESLTYGYANHIGWSDVNPYEIVKVVSDKTIDIRPMDATRDESWKPEFVSGGYAGHCVNQCDQKWDVVSNDDAPLVRARLRKDGYYHSVIGKHLLGDKPRKFYDFNF
jgi:hypothetical protein